MGGLIIACVWTGREKYNEKHVRRLAAGVRRWMPPDVPYDFICLTDQKPIEGIDCYSINGYQLRGWWAKMLMFKTRWRGERRLVYLDLDTVVMGPLKKLIDVKAEFAICQNFAQLNGATGWPCKYGSAVMVMAPGYGQKVWNKFNHHRDMMIAAAGRYGDQKIIETLVPDAQFLQPLLPKGFFSTYRDLPERKPEASLLMFGGSNKPEMCGVKWVQDEWRGKIAA